MTDSPRQAGSGVWWFMRALALLGLAIAGYLGYIHIAALAADTSAAVPLCGGLPRVDCESVLNSRWSMVLGVPTAAIGAGVYLAMFVALMRRWTWLAMTLAVAIIAAAGWFTSLQAFELDTWCSYCMLDHVVGFVLALMVLLYAHPVRSGAAAPRWGARRAGAVGLGLLGGATLIGLQLADSPDYIDRITLPADPNGPWVETDDPDAGLSLLDGTMVLDPEAHPRLGLPMADRYIVEVIDFICSRCRAFHPKLSAARRELGDRTAVLIVFSPLHPECNRYLDQANEAYADSCELTRLAAAVWLARPRQYQTYHDAVMTADPPIDAARAAAREIVGADRLNELLADPRVDRLIERDVELARRLELRGGLPGLIVDDVRFAALPEDAGTLVQIIRQARSR